MTTVFIIEDHSVVVEGVLALLQNEKEILVTGHVDTAEKCLHFLKTSQPNVVLLDINLPDISGIDLCKIIKQQSHYHFP